MRVLVVVCFFIIIVAMIRLSIGCYYQWPWYNGESVYRICELFR